MPQVYCKFCKQSFSVEQGGLYLCPHCREQQEVSIQGGQTGLDAKEKVNQSFYARLRDTWLEIIQRPTVFFRTMDPKAGVRDALLYGVIINSVGIFAGFVFQGWISLFSGSSKHDALPHWFQSPFGSETGFLLLMALLVAPCFALLSLWLAAAVLHGSLLIIKASRHEFPTTLRMVCYAHSPHLLSIIPLLGSGIASIWTLGLTVIGIREVHQTTTGKAILAIVLPFLICCCGAGILASMGLIAGLSYFEKFIKGF